MADVEKLRQLIGQPLRKPEPVDWPEVEQELGFPLPADYKAIASEYPGFSVGDFLNVLHPTQANSALNLITYGRGLTDDRREFLEEFPDAEDHDHPYRPDEGGLYCWAVSNNGDECYWLTAGPTESWLILVQDKVESWEFKGSFARFVIGLLTGELKCPLFPDDFDARRDGVRHFD